MLINIFSIEGADKKPICLFPDFFWLFGSFLKWMVFVLKSVAVFVSHNWTHSYVGVNRAYLVGD